MSGFLSAFGPTLAKAAAWIGLLTAGLYAATLDRRLAKSYCAAHAAAIGLGVLIDLAIARLVLAGRAIPMAYLQAYLLAPIVFFTAFSLRLSRRGLEVRAWHVLGSVLPIVVWGLLVVFGPQDMGEVDVIGAWFVSAGCGALDLVARYGPARLTRWAQPAGYPAVVLLLYLVLPRL